MPESRRAFLSRKYDELFDKASEVVKKHNPCAVTDGVCRAGRKIENGLCCTGCRHLGPNGCKVKALLCKIWLCRHCDYSCPDDVTAYLYWKDMGPIAKEASDLHLCSPRCSKWKSINAVLLFGKELTWFDIRGYYHNDHYRPPSKYGRIS